MNDYSELTDLMERVVHKYSRWENQKRPYGTDIPLSRAEIHTIAAVGDNPGINITSLAEILGITKGAASQMIYKLADKGSVEKQTSPDSDTEGGLHLTYRGILDYEAHRRYHSETSDRALSMLKDMPESLFKNTLTYLSAFEQTMDELLEDE